MNKDKEATTEANEPYIVEAETPPEEAAPAEEATESLIMPKKKRWALPSLKKGPLSKKERIIFICTLAVILLAGAGLLWWLNTHQPEAGPHGSGKVAVKKYYSPLNGVQVADEAATKRVVTAVMIENSPDARPQSGLAEADLVFEAVAEGGITRFIALYQPSRPALVGPVRSLRPYYVDWAAAFQPSVAHVGGSPEALDMIRSGNYGNDIDQFFNAGSYWRAGDRAAPHNMYTSFDRLDELNTSKNFTSSNFKFAPRKDGKTVAEPTATHVDVQVSSGLFSTSYDYDAAKNTYNRNQGGAAHVDREKGQISPSVVVVLKTDVSLSGDGSHMSIATSGGGEAYVFQNGTVTEGVWSKADAKGQLFIKNKEGRDITLVRGQTWIAVIGKDRSVSWQ